MFRWSIVAFIHSSSALLLRRFGAVVWNGFWCKHGTQMLHFGISDFITELFTFQKKGTHSMSTPSHAHILNRLLENIRAHNCCTISYKYILFGIWSVMKWHMPSSRRYCCHSNANRGNCQLLKIFSSRFNSCMLPYVEYTVTIRSELVVGIGCGKLSPIDVTLIKTISHTHTHTHRIHAEIANFISNHGNNKTVRSSKEHLRIKVAYVQYLHNAIMKWLRGNTQNKLVRKRKTEHSTTKMLQVIWWWLTGCLLGSF